MKGPAIAKHIGPVPTEMLQESPKSRKKPQDESETYATLVSIFSRAGADTLRENVNNPREKTDTCQFQRSIQIQLTTPI